MIDRLKQHWPEYAMEATELAVFMVAACSFAVALQHPSSPLPGVLPPLARRVVTGLLMGATAIAIIYSPFGKRSGAHFNPAVTLTFFRLGKIAAWDAVFYVLSQFAGGIAGVFIALALLGTLVAHPSVNYVATVPGMLGIGAAFLAELLMAFVMMSMVLRVTNTPKLARFTGIFSGILVATFISIDAPISGMSLNPARSLGSDLPARMWSGLWLYLIAPPLGMSLAAELYRFQRGAHRVACAKLHHDNDERCIFRCGYVKPVSTAR
jgi:aquaporin Z